jgi:putative ATP-dependent endonuclease of OLD family
VEELLKANNTILAKEPIKKTKEIINSNLLDIEQDLLRQQIDIGLVNPKFESIASSLRSWIVPRWFFIGDDYPYYATLCEKCKELTFSKLIQKTNDGMYIDVNGVLQSDIDKELSSSLSSLMGHSFELYQNGLGYNNILFMSAVLGDMSLDRNGVSLNLFIVEEPEAHLHPQLQELIHRFFERRHDESSFVQIIYTSHSPTLVSRIGISAINLLFEVDHSVQCYPLANAKLEESEKDYLEKYLDVTKSQMFFAKGIIFVEGISEALLLPEMAKLLKRPFDKFAVEIVNINGTSFKPFAKILTLPTGVKCFARAAIITDDDRCTNIYEPTTYINKDLDFDVDLADIKQRLQKGTASARYDDMDELCVSANIELYGAFKTFEYELASEPNNIPYILEVTSDIFPKIGLKLRNLVEDETESINKAMRIWLFIRSRENIKGQIAQSLCRILQKQIRDINTGIQVMNPFVVPSYIAKAIYSVTEPEC